MRILFLVIMLAISLISCTRDVPISNHIIKIDLNEPSELDKLPEIEIVSVVPLESTDFMLIGSFDVIEYFDDKIYVLDIFKSSAVFAFSDLCKFIGKTKSGKAPRELVNPFAFYPDRQSKEIYIWDQGALAMQI